LEILQGLLVHMLLACLHSTQGAFDLFKMDFCSTMGFAFWQVRSVSLILYDNTFSNQGPWHSVLAYDACVRLCLNAWARGCLEAPIFLENECALLRNAFG